MNLWYLSFCDPDIGAAIPVDEQRPGGPSWLGGCFVPGTDIVSASSMAHTLGCNPGGEVAGWGPISVEVVKPGYVGRLLNRQEIEDAYADG